MKIGIIGAGFIGQAVAQLALAAGHEVMLSNSRGPKTLDSVVAGIPGSCAGTVEEASTSGDTVVIAIPFGHYREIPSALLEGKTVLDANNYYPTRDGHIAVLDRLETTTSQLLAEHLPGARIVKVFNAILAQDLLNDGRPNGAAGRRALPVASDDPAAKQDVIRFLDELGFDAVDGGNLSESWRFERAKPAYCIPMNAPELENALAAARRDVEVPEGSWRRH